MALRDTLNDILGLGSVTTLDLDPVGLLIDESPEEIVYSDPSGALVVADEGLLLHGNTGENFDAVATCLRAITDTIDSIPIYTTNKKDEPTASVLDDLMKYPNPYMRWSVLCNLIVRDLHLWGEFFIYVQRDKKNVPIAIYPLRASAVNIYIAEDGSLLYKFNGATFVNKLGEPPQVLHGLQRPRPGIPVRGQSTISSLRYVVAHGTAADSFQYKSALDGKQKYALSSDARLTPDQMKEVGEAWKEATHGAGTWNKTPVLPYAMKPHALSMSSADMELLNSVKLDRIRIAASFGCSALQLGDTERLTFNNARTLKLLFLQTAVVPILNELCDVLYRGILESLPSFRVRYNLGPVSKAEPTMLARQSAIEVKSGIRTPEQAAIAAGYQWEGDHMTNSDWLKYVSKMGNSGAEDSTWDKDDDTDPGDSGKEPK